MLLFFLCISWVLPKFFFVHSMYRYILLGLYLRVKLLNCELHTCFTLLGIPKLFTKEVVIIYTPTCFRKEELLWYFWILSRFPDSNYTQSHLGFSSALRLILQHLWQMLYHLLTWHSSGYCLCPVYLCSKLLAQSRQSVNIYCMNGCLVTGSREPDALREMVGKKTTHRKYT